MGCLCSGLRSETHPEKQNNHHDPQPKKRRSFARPPAASAAHPEATPTFAEFSLADLKAATNGFSSDQIVSESGEKAPNIVYRGRLQTHRSIAVKKFNKLAWPDPNQFAEEARGIGKLRHARLANLIGYCCEGDERLLVAEYMPNTTLAKHLFHCTRSKFSVLDLIMF